MSRAVASEVPLGRRLHGNTAGRHSPPRHPENLSINSLRAALGEHMQLEAEIGTSFGLSVRPVLEDAGTMPASTRAWRGISARSTWTEGQLESRLLLEEVLREKPHVKKPRPEPPATSQ